MDISTTIYTPRTLYKVVSRTPAARTFIKDTFFKNHKTFTTRSVDVDFKKGNRALAPFVHPKVGGKAILNTGFKTQSYTPPLLMPKKITTVDDLLDRRAGENPYSGKTGAERAVEKLSEDFRELKELIVRRQEWMAAQAVFTGQIPVVGEGLNEVIDFGFSNLETIINAAQKWNSTTADPFADIERWYRQVQKKGFTNCDICIMSSDVSAAFINNEKVQKQLDVKAYDLAKIKPRDLPGGATYIGTYHKLGLDIYEYNEWYLDDWSDPANPIDMPMVPAGTVALMSTGADYSLYYAAITMLDKNEKFITVEGDMVPGTWVKRDPDRRFVQITSSPLPVPHEVDSWFVAKVL